MASQKQIKQSFWQGILRLYLLHLAGRGPIYGGEVKKQLQDFGYDISPGSLYPLLHALEEATLFQSRLEILQGRARRYYEITLQGRACLATLRQELTGVLQDVLAESKGPVEPPLPQEGANVGRNTLLG